MTQYTFEEAVDIVLKMQTDLGYMPEVRDFKKDNTISTEGLMKALKVDSPSAIVVAVCRELRKRRGEPKKILSKKPKRSELTSEEIARRQRQKEEAEQKHAEEKQKVLAKVRAKPYGLMEPVVTKPRVDRPEVALKQAELVKETEVKEEMVEKTEKKAEKRTYKRWTDKEVAEVVMEFYDEYKEVPSHDDALSGGRFKTMGKSTPSNRTLHKVLGSHRSEWLESCKMILGYEVRKEMTKEELPEEVGRETAALTKELGEMGFFDAIKRIREVVQGDELRGVRGIAEWFNFDIGITTEINGVKMHFIAETK